MNSAFSQLSKSAANYGASYTKVTEKITEKLTGKKIPAAVSNSKEDNSPTWAKWAMGLFSLTSGNLAGVAMAGAGFDWKNILLNLITVLSVSTILASFTGIVLGRCTWLYWGWVWGFCKQTGSQTVGESDEKRAGEISAAGGSRAVAADSRCC